MGGSMSQTFTMSVFPQDNFIDLSLFQYGREFCDPGHSFGPVKRNHYLFHYVVSGCGQLLADDSNGATQTYNIRSGQGFLIFPDQTNTYVADHTHPWEYIWIEFDGLRVRPSLLSSSLSPDHPVYHAKSREYRDQMFEEMQYLVNHSSETAFHQIGHLYLFFDALIRSVQQPNYETGNKTQDFYIREALHYIENNYMTDLSIEEIARHSGIDRTYFSKLFKKSVGSSPQQFLINYRMVKAAEMLKLTNQSVKDIGMMVGYPNQLHFSRAFKSVYGMSPLPWRKANRGHK